jgi:hypothetical protein
MGGAFMVQGQEIDTTKRQSKEYEPPSAYRFQPERYRPKLGEFSYRSFYGYGINPTREIGADPRTQMNNERLIKAKLGIPILIKDKYLLGLQLTYYEQRFQFSEEVEGIGPLLREIENTKFYTSGIRLIHQYNIDDDRKITQAAGFGISSDRFEFDPNAYKVFYTAGYAQRLNDRVSLGGAIYIDYTFGVLRIFPVFDYTKELSDHWTLALSLPKKAQIRYNVNNHLYLNTKAEVKSWRYRFHTDQFGTESDEHSIRKMDLLYTLGLEREIYDFLWFGMDAGIAYNLQNFVGGLDGRRRGRYLSFDTDIQGYFKAGIFLVPPRSIYD